MVLDSEAPLGGKLSERTAAIRHSYGRTAEEVKRGTFRWGEGITGRVLASGLPAIVQDVDAKSLFLLRTVISAPRRVGSFISRVMTVCSSACSTSSLDVPT